MLQAGASASATGGSVVLNIDFQSATYAALANQIWPEALMLSNSIS